MSSTDIPELHIPNLVISPGNPKSSTGSLLRSTAAVLSLVNPQVDISFPTTDKSGSKKALELLDRLSLFFVHGSHADVVAISAQVTAEVLDTHLAVDDDDDDDESTMSTPNVKRSSMELSIGHNSAVAEPQPNTKE
jgi:hypothetical protein